jgi:peptide/nickel transport system substrate-binding protein
LDLDPSTSQDNDTSMQLWNAWFQHLIKPNPSGSGYVPMLASSFSVSPNHLVYTFHVRQGVKFSNGQPMTTADVLYSLDRDFAPAASLLSFLKPFLLGISSPKPDVIQVRLKRPWSALLADLSSPTAAIYPKGAFTKGTAASFFTTHPIGTGPFKLVSVAPNSQYVVERNPYYWDTAEKPLLNKITFEIVTDDNARATAVLSGRADIALAPPANQIPSYKANSSVRVDTLTSSLVELICFNLKVAPLNNVLVRRAISLALNRAEIVRAGLFGYGAPASTFLVGPSAATFQNTSLNLYPFDPAKAKQLLKQSGIKLPVTIPFEVSTGTAQQAILTNAQSDLSAVGINLKVTTKDSASVDNDIIGEKYAMATTFWGDIDADSADQVLFAVDPAFGSNAYFTSLRDTSLISLAHKAAVEPSHSVEQQLYDQIQTRFANDASMAPLYYPQLIHLLANRVTQFNVNPYGFYDWAKIGVSN